MLELSRSDEPTDANLRSQNGIVLTGLVVKLSLTLVCGVMKVLRHNLLGAIQKKLLDTSELTWAMAATNELTNNPVFVRGKVKRNEGKFNPLTGIPVPLGMQFGSDSGGLLHLNTVAVPQSVQYPRLRIRISSSINWDRFGRLSPIATVCRRGIPTLIRASGHSSRLVRILPVDH